MKTKILHIILFFCLTQQLYSQQDGVFAFSLPVRNSLKFNKYAINPTFSFVREQNKYITFTNKRQWVQFDNAPQTYLFSYSGRLKENIGVGVGFFQQNYGVLTGFGGVVNFAYNVVLDRDNNLTFGANLGYYQSGINTGDVIADLSDPSLANVPTNSILTINPGINYGTTFFDFGVSINNAVSYNLSSSEVLEGNPEQVLQVHAMYTGYVNSRGFFDNSKFSSLVRSEFKKEKTVFSGLMMLTVPKGIWGQIGYNSLYGASAGIGINVSEQIAIEYNFEQSIGDLSTFGSSHEVTLAYKFKKKDRFIYNGDEEEEALLVGKKKRRVPVKQNRKEVTAADREAIAKAKEEAKVIALEKIQAKAEEREKLVAEAKAKRDAKIKEFENKKVNSDLASKTESEEDAQIKLEEETKRKALESAKLKEEEIAKTKTESEEDAQIKLEEETKRKALEAAKLKEEEIAKAKADEVARIKLEEETKRKALEAAKLKEEEIAKTKAEAEEVARIKLEEETNRKALETTKLKEEEILTSNAKDDISKSMNDITRLAEESKIIQQKLLVRLTNKVDTKQQDLDDLKKENDLGEQGIIVAPKPFKSIRGEKEALEALKLELDNVIESQDDKISELQSLYKKRLRKFRDKNDPDNMFFSNAIETLKSSQSRTINSKKQLLFKLANIDVATEIERKRRIKRAAYDNEEDRFVKDKAALDRIKKFTEPSDVELTTEDFDFGEKQNNIQIIKDIKNVDSGYYLVLAVHSSIEKRDEFLTKVVATGQKNINFFFDVASNKYYIYNEKFDDIGQAQRSIQNKNNAPYNSKMSMVKIEN